MKITEKNHTQCMTDAIPVSYYGSEEQDPCLPFAN